MADTRNPGTIMGEKAIAARMHLAREHLDRLRAIVKEPGRWVSVWFLAYALLGAVSSGLLPILLPLMIVALTHHLSWVAYRAAIYGIVRGIQLSDKPFLYWFPDKRVTLRP